MPLINQMFPGSGITYRNVLQTECQWWLIYAGQAKDAVAEATTYNTKKRRAGRG